MAPKLSTVMFSVLRFKRSLENRLESNMFTPLKHDEPAGPVILNGTDMVFFFLVG